jgi:hypothetical protein
MPSMAAITSFIICSKIKNSIYRELGLIFLSFFCEYKKFLAKALIQTKEFSSWNFGSAWKSSDKKKCIFLKTLKRSQTKNCIKLSFNSRCTRFRLHFLLLFATLEVIYPRKCFFPALIFHEFEAFCSIMRIVIFGK